MIPRLPAVAVLGTGAMGAPIAANLLAAGFPVSVWNRTRSKVQPLADKGALIAHTPSDAAAAAEIVVTMLADGDAALHTMTSPEGGLAALARGSVWIQMGTIGRRTLWLGPAGTGMRLKVAANNWLVTQVEAAAETLALVETLGVDPHLLVEVMADGPLGSPFAVAKANAMLAHDFAPGFPLHLAFKDAGLALAAARERELELPLTAAVTRRWADAIAAGHGDEDVSSAFVQAQRPWPAARAA